MSKVQTRHVFDIGQITLNLGAPGRELTRSLQARAVVVQSYAKQRLREAPQRIDTGNLINSIQVQIYRRDGKPIARIGTSVEYAIYVHEGTVHMEANPFLRDALTRGYMKFR